ncbi:MAG: CRISPR-associated helicase/endonuclease Cas3, partial [Chloroflexi bacterium]
EFETIVINTLRPFASADYDFQERFNKLFDGLDVLPADLHNDYYDLAEDGRFIEARQLLVPISWARFHILRNAGQIRWDNELQHYIVFSPYNSEFGLDLSKV